jgi:hypothetical protein
MGNYIEHIVQQESLLNKIEQAKVRSIEVRGELLSWLSPFDFEQDHDRIRKKRFRTTGEWLLKSPDFLAWISSIMSCLLWCHGTRKTTKPFKIEHVLTLKKRALGSLF